MIGLIIDAVTLVASLGACKFAYHAYQLGLTNNHLIAQNLWGKKND